MVWNVQTGERFVYDLCYYWIQEVYFVTTVLLRPDGTELARATVFEDEEFVPCWDEAICFAQSAKEQGVAILGWPKELGNPERLSNPNEFGEFGGLTVPRRYRPRLIGAGLRLFSNDELVGILGVLGLPPGWIIDTLSKVAPDYDVTIADLPS